METEDTKREPLIKRKNLFSNRYFQKFRSFNSSTSDEPMTKIKQSSYIEDADYLVNRKPTVYGDLPAYLYKYKESYKVRWQVIKEISILFPTTNSKEILLIIESKVFLFK